MADVEVHADGGRVNVLHQFEELVGGLDEQAGLRLDQEQDALLLGVLGDGPKRFNELRRALGSISQRMLTLTLRGLERDGLVTRTMFPSIPPRVDYALTKLGRSLLEPVSGLGLWARQNRSAIDDARRRFDAGKN